MPAFLSTAVRLFLFALGALAFAVAWMILRTHTGGTSTWMAVLAALDAWVLLRFLGLPRGTRGALAGAGFVLLTIALANYGTVALFSGASLGFTLQESLLRMGPGLGLDLIRLAHGPWDLVWYVIGVELAAWWCA